MGSFYIPKEDESRNDSQGEDSHFVCQEKKSFGLADSVGAWIKEGIDSGEYSRHVMNNSLVALNQYYERKGYVKPTRVLKDAYYVTEFPGSSTACIVTLNDDAANVGDSGILLAYTSRFGDGANVITEIVVSVQSGDIVVAGTDGLLDNMFPSEIEEILTKTLDRVDHQTPEDLAWTIAEYALYNSFDRYSESPFSRAAHLAGKNRVGGKIDDITVVVAKII
ncbi:hypothetical protein Dsin_016111 [Dipteronia sinensis]|uniref:Protein phosphatase n=1 Tax=Dipteronia sinensis TaxID=43782 RepID=A0AAE0ADV0_9ROSI|nr:hypothetical protein Dsin_016111 [Dipteronia sinensis]